MLNPKVPGPIGPRLDCRRTLKSKAMFRASLILTVALLAAATSPVHGEDAVLSPPIFCAHGLPGGLNCSPSKKDLKASRQAFERGMKLHDHNQLEEALSQFEEAALLNPQSAQFLTAREALKAKLVFGHIQRGNRSEEHTSELQSL